MFYLSHKFLIVHKLAAFAVMFMLVFGSMPQTIFAEDATSTPDTNVEPVELEETEDEDTASSTDEQGEDDADEDTASSTEDVNDPETKSATSSATTTDETSELDGDDGEGTPDVATTTDETATSTGGNPGDEGSGGNDGDGGEGTEDTATSTNPEPESDPIPVVTEGLIGDDDSPEDEDVTGGQRRHSRYDVTVETGRATAQGEIFTQANSNNVKSTYEPGAVSDLDFYTFTATGTNDANVVNDVASVGVTGENLISTLSEGTITTGDAIATFNVANVINSNIVNSDGYVYLANQILEEEASLNLQDFFFPEAGSALEDAQNCSLLSCAAEDIEYNVMQMNHATITNDAYIEAISGYNDVEGDRSEITTGDAFGTANIVNVVNTNIIDSNYRLLTFNAVGDLDGDLILPTEELFEMFFGLPNGMNQLESSEEARFNVDNENSVLINNNVDTYAESGQNDATVFDGSITTGNSESESNVLNKVNENILGGDLMYLWIRVHGSWAGDVVGLPDGLTWMWTSDGVIIYNEDAEIEPSEFLGIDIDSYTANIENDNRIVLNNNINIDAVSGENVVSNSLVGNITTGDSFASGNVMNIANTNVIGANWTMAIVNVLGDFGGNVTFSQTDLSLSGEAHVSDDLLGRGSVITFTYTVANSSDNIATDVLVRHALDNAHISGGSASTQSVSIGDLDPGETKIVDLIAVVDEEIAEGTTTVRSVATVESNEGDSDTSDNTVIDTFEVFYASTTPDVDTGAGTSTTGDGSNGTTTDETGVDDTGNDDSITPVPETKKTGSSRGGGGGSKPNEDPDRPPFIILKKKSDVDPEKPVPAGKEVNYTITLKNNGGTAYDATVYDVLVNPIGAVLSEQSWDLGTILADEVITLEYTTTYDVNTPSGTYTNTASIETYRYEDTKENGERPLRLDDAVHTIEIVGVPLAVGNVQALAYYPGAQGVNALVTWETNAPATGQVLHSPSEYSSVYNPLLENFGYESGSYRFETPKTKHYMIVRALTPGMQYRYKIRATNDEHEALGGDYYFTVPSSVHTLTLAFPSSNSRVAGVTTSQPAAVSAPVTPAPVVPVPAYVPPVPVSTLRPVPEAAPEPEPEPEQVPPPEPEPVEQASSSGGFMSKIFGFFR